METYKFKPSIDATHFVKHELHRFSLKFFPCPTSSLLRIIINTEDYIAPSEGFNGTTN